MNYYLVLIVIGILTMVALSLAKFFKLQVTIENPESHGDYRCSIELEKK